MKVILFRLNNSSFVFNRFTYIGLIFGAISYNVYDNRDTLHKYYEKYKEPKPAPKPQPTNNEPFLPKIVIKEVLQKNEILELLAKLIPKIVEKPSIQHNITK